VDNPAPLPFDLTTIGCGMLPKAALALHKNVNNTVYFRYMETSRIDWCRSIGCTPHESGEGPVIVNAWCNFLQQLRYPGDVRVQHHVTTVGTKSFDTYITMERTDQPGVIWAEGGARMVWIDFKDNRSLALPDWLREKIG